MICREFLVNSKSSLPLGAKRALQLYQHGEAQREAERMHAQVRLAIRKLLASRRITGRQAIALSLYAGVDRHKLRSYSEVGQLMGIGKERVRQLLFPSKLILSEMLNGYVPWKPLAETTATALETKKRFRKSTSSSSIRMMKNPIQIAAKHLSLHENQR